MVPFGARGWMRERAEERILPREGTPAHRVCLRAGLIQRQEPLWRDLSIHAGPKGGWRQYLPLIIHLFSISTLSVRSPRRYGPVDGVFRPELRFLTIGRTS